MKTIGNIIWFIFGGFFQWLAWIFVGLIWCVTIIGIPIGVQCFKLAKISLFPFGKEIQYGGGSGSILLNILWLIFGGLELAIAFALNGILFYILIVTIPFGKQCFKMAGLALRPFGAQVVKK